jgi:hypothetical protein
MAVQSWELTEIGVLEIDPPSGVARQVVLGVSTYLCDPSVILTTDVKTKGTRLFDPS